MSATFETDETNGKDAVAAFLGSRPEANTTLLRFQTIIQRILANDDRRPSLVTEIASVVGSEILSGARAPGSDLNSVELARSFRTSRTPTREAVVLLKNEGLVEILPRRRPRVAILSLPEIREIYHIRSVLLALIAMEVTAGNDAAGIARLRAILNEMQKAADEKDLEAYFWSNVSFHEQFAELSGNRTLQRIIDSLTLRSLRLRRLTLASSGRIHRSLVDHVRLVEALEEGDGELAAALAKANVLSALTSLEKLLGEPHSAGGSPRPSVPILGEMV